jgi:sugar phosphate isomerase/epimerase
VAIFVSRSAPSTPALAAPPPRAVLGFDIRGHSWPTHPLLSSLEGAGFGWIQVVAPPADVLADWRSCAHVAAALREAVEPTRLRLIVHAPPGLDATAPGLGPALAALVDFAEEAGAGQVVYHALDVPVRRRGDGAAVDFLAEEERALRAAVRRAERAAVTLSLENGAPDWPGPPRAGHDVAALAMLVRRLSSPRARLCLDVGHAHIAADAARAPLDEVIGPVLDETALFQLHDNLGARRGNDRPPGIPPLRLDLHLAPGRGTLPWHLVGPLIAARLAPSVLEIALPRRPEPGALATVTAELLARPLSAP